MKNLDYGLIQTIQSTTKRDPATGLSGIVAFGDSLTYGAGMLRERTWPQQLERLSKKRTYNISYGGYCPTHSLLLLEEAIELKPQLIILAIYAGNDLYDAYNFVYNKKKLPGLRTTDKNIIKAMADSESNRPFSRPRIKPVRSKWLCLRLFILKHSRFCGILRLATSCYETRARKFDNPFWNLYWRLIKAEAKRYEEDEEIFEKGILKTLLKPQPMLMALNSTDPRIIEGHRICLEVINLISKRAKEAEIEFAVLFIPTRELVYKDVVFESGFEISKTYRTMVEDEELMWKKTGDFLKSRGIDYYDSLPALRGCLLKDEQPYRMTCGYLTFAGHHAIAETIYREIEQK